MPLYRHHARRAQAVAVTSLKNAALSTDLPSNTNHVVEIPWGVDNSKYIPLDEASRLQMMAERQRRFGAGPIVGFVGRFVRYKALPMLLDAITRLPKVRAVLVGDGPLRSQVEQQAKAAGLMDRVHFLGSVDERSKINLMNMMDMLVMPSNETTEAFGVAQVEAHLLGLPVIATNLPTGVTDITVDGHTGLLVPPDDPQGIADAITQLVDNPVYARGLGANGRQRALRHFTLDAFEHKWTRLIEAVLAGRRADELAHLTTATAYELPSGF
jgi:rhamnosyl/mannosyltransferase